MRICCRNTKSSARVFENCFILNHMQLKFSAVLGYLSLSWYTLKHDVFVCVFYSCAGSNEDPDWLSDSQYDEEMDLEGIQSHVSYSESCLVH
jgi:hypothetical protein